MLQARIKNGWVHVLQGGIVVVRPAAVVDVVTLATGSLREITTLILSSVLRLWLSLSTPELDRVGAQGEPVGLWVVLKHLHEHRVC